MSWLRNFKTKTAIDSSQIKYSPDSEDTKSVKDAIDAISSADNPYIRLERVRFETYARPGSRVTITAPAVDGYTFAAWLLFAPSGWSAVFCPSTPLSATTNVVTVANSTNSTDNSTLWTVYAVALFVKG